MSLEERATPSNIRRIEFVSWDGKANEMLPDGQAWVDENGVVRGDTEYVNRILDGGIRGPNFLVSPRRAAVREDGPAMLFGFLAETANATYWGIRVLELDESQ